MAGKGSNIGYGAAAIFAAGALVGFLAATTTLRQPETPTNLALKASYMASGSDRRPTGFTQVARQAAVLWDQRNAAGFEWGLRLGVGDPRLCPGVHGPFHAGCVEAAQAQTNRFIGQVGVR